MKLKDMTLEELETLSYTKIAQMYLEENNKTMSTNELFKEVCNLLKMTEDEYQDNIADFFQSLSTTKDFILLNDGKWDLKSKHKVKINMDEIYEEKDDEDEDEKEDEDESEELIDDELDEDYNDIDEDFADDDLSDLSIIDEEDLERDE